MSDELKRCPFDGGEGWIVEDRDGPLLYRPQCKRCGGGLGGFELRADAVAHWNRRAPEQQPAEPRVEGDLADFIRDQVCCPRIHGCELGGSEHCPAERVRAALAALPATCGGEEDLASRDHEQTVSGALEWGRQGSALFSYAQNGWYRGAPVMVNRIWVRVDHDYRYAAPEDAAAVLDCIQAALSSAMPADREKSRDDHRKSKFKKAEAELAEAREVLADLLTEIERWGVDMGDLTAAGDDIIVRARSLTNQDRSTTVEGE